MVGYPLAKSTENALLFLEVWIMTHVFWGWSTDFERCRMSWTRRMESQIKGFLWGFCRGVKVSHLLRSLKLEWGLLVEMSVSSSWSGNQNLWRYVGGGCVLAKVPDESDPRGWRWSGPSSVVCAGLSGGFTFGAERVESLILLNTKSAVKGFMGDDQITFGGNLSIAAGPGMQLLRFLHLKMIDFWM